MFIVILYVYCDIFSLHEQVLRFPELISFTSTESKLQLEQPRATYFNFN